MNRRQFLSLLSASTAVLPLVRVRGAAIPRSGPLFAHRIAAVEARVVPLPWVRHVGRNSKRDVHGFQPARPTTAFILKTDQGSFGWGEIAGDPKSLEAMRAALVGKLVGEVFQPDIGIMQPELQPVDFALHDLAGVILGQPVWRMLGAEKPHLFPLYSGMIYFDDLYPEDNPAGIDQVLKNCAADHAYGYRQLKIKIGRGRKWMTPDAGLRRDVEIVRAIANSFPDCGLLVDGNDGFSADGIIAFLKGLGGIPLVWIEEPFVENERDWRKLHAWTRANGYGATLLADGETNISYPVLERLEMDGILQVRLTDISKYGFTRWRELMPRLLRTRTQASPHTWGSGLKTVYTAHLLGALGNAPTIEGVTCSHEHVDFGENRLQHGMMQLSSKPGFGLTLRQ